MGLKAIIKDLAVVVAVCIVMAMLIRMTIYMGMPCSMGGGRFSLGNMLIEGCSNGTPR